MIVIGFLKIVYGVEGAGFPSPIAFILFLVSSFQYLEIKCLKCAKVPKVVVSLCSVIFKIVVSVKGRDQYSVISFQYLVSSF